MSAQAFNDDRLAGAAPLGYQLRRASQGSSDDSAVKLAELKVETSYLRRDLDDVVRIVKETKADVGQVKEALAEVRSAVKSLPTYKEMYVTIALILSIFAAIIVFAEKIRNSIGI